LKDLKKDEKYGYLTLKNKPNKESLKQFYFEKYYQNNHGNFEKKISEYDLINIENESKIIEYIQKNNFSNINKHTLLDLGCGQGHHSNYFFNKNWKVSLVDSSEYGILNHNSHLKNHFTNSDLEPYLDSLRLKNKKFSIIILNGVLEHLINPKLILRKIKQVMDENTLLYVNVPNDYSRFQEYLIKNDFTENTWHNPPEHLNYFQFDTFENLFIGEGFTKLSLLASFPIEIFLTNRFSNYFKHKNRGKEAHISRCNISNYLIEESIEKYIKLSEAYANLHFGRTISGFFKLNF